MLQKEHLLAKIGFDTAGNEPRQVCCMVRVSVLWAFLYFKYTVTVAAGCGAALYDSGAASCTHILRTDRRDHAGRSWAMRPDESTQRLQSRLPASSC